MSEHQYVMIAEHLMAAKMFSLASCVMLFYDIAITFGEEVERIWLRPFSGATVLWFLNRYLSPLGYIVVIVAFHDPSWGPAACNRYVLFPEVLKIFTATAVGIIFILRLYAIYSRSRTILVVFSLLLMLELAVKIYAFTDGVRLQLPPGLVGCVLTGKSAPGARIVYTWVAELIFDSCVFFSTLYKALQLHRSMAHSTASELLRIFLRDGIMYFAVIFVSNLVTTVIFVSAPPDLKVINASFSTLITSLMVSRLMLNLRQDPERLATMRSRRSSTLVRDPLAGSQSENKNDFTATVIGNLGQPVSYWDDERDDRDGAVMFTTRHSAILDYSDDYQEAFEMNSRRSSITPSRDRM
jgi:hypothetical protein